jgi:hypothetical protein
VRRGESRIEIALELTDRKSHKNVADRVVVCEADSFADAYDWALANEETLLERLHELIAAAKVAV